MKGFYLTLCLKVENVSYYENRNEKTKQEIENDKKLFKKYIVNEYKQTDLDLNFEMFNTEMNIDLNSEGKYRPSSYEKAAIFSKYYKASEIPNDSDIEKDLLELVKIYEFILEKNIYEKFRNKEELYFVDFNDFLVDKGYYFDPDLVSNFLISLSVNPFVILTGNSGTGKTKLAQLLGSYINKKYDIPDDGIDSHYEVIPVGANWTDNRNLLGFENIITNTYHSTPALKLILKANANPKQPYLLILDEMNLSHVERYFSDFLSAMESKEDISLYAFRNNMIEILKIKETNAISGYYYVDKMLIPFEIEIPTNLFIIGTVNVDETTYMFSPKVLDRANVLEFESPTISSFLTENSVQPIDNSKDFDYIQNIMKNKDFKEMRKSQFKEELDKNIYLSIITELNELYTILEKSGFDFGIRVINEIIRFIIVAWNYEKSENFDLDKYIDVQIKQKILPKLHGSDVVIGDTLRDLYKFCLGNEENKIKYEKSALKIQQMIDVLERQKFVSFIN